MILEMTGARIGFLTVVGRASLSKDGAQWNCICDCGNEAVRLGTHLRRAQKNGVNCFCGNRCKAAFGLNDNKKICATCKIKKEADSFAKSANLISGLQSSCKDCTKIWRTKNHQLVKKLRDEYFDKNREELRIKNRERGRRDKKGSNRRSKEWRERNPEKRKMVTQAWAKRNLDYMCFMANKRRASMLKAIPSWADLENIKDIYKKAKVLGYHVDHIVPLCSPKVCGLHCEQNLQIIPPAENFKKNNKYWPDMP